MGRIIVFSSMSAFAGTSQLYGRAKLDIEAMTIECGGCAVRPGLVYSDQAGGMAGAMRKLTTLPIVPVIAGGAGVYTVREEDLMRAIALLASATTLEPGTISIAHPNRVTLPDLLRTFAAQESRRCRFVPVPWQLVYWLLRSGELMRLRLPFRADSLLGLIHTAPSLSGRRSAGPARCHRTCVQASQGSRSIARRTLMRILLLAQFFPPDIGGEERHVFNLAKALAGRGHEVAVATQRMADVPDQETLTSGVRVHRFATAAMRLPGVYSSSRTHHPPLPDPLGVRELSRITRQERPHVVHAHNWIVNSALALRRSSPTRWRFGLVLTLHDFSHVCATKRLMRMGSPCEGPAVARCLPCATAHYGPGRGTTDRGRHGTDAPMEEPGYRPRGLREQRCRQWQPYPAWPEQQHYP